MVLSHITSSKEGAAAPGVNRHQGPVQGMEAAKEAFEQTFQSLWCAMLGASEPRSAHLHTLVCIQYMCAVYVYMPNSAYDSRHSQGMTIKVTVLTELTVCPRRQNSWKRKPRIEH